MIVTEEWRPVPGYEGLYEISNEARLRGWAPHRGFPVPRIISTKPDKLGYHGVTLYRKGTRHYTTLHVLVCTAFRGPRPTDAHEVRHLDGVPSHNYLSNLLWGTRRQNQLDKQRHGTDPHRNITHCPQQHPYDAENTYVTKTGARLCRTCNRERQRARRRTTGLPAARYADPTHQKEPA